MAKARSRTTTKRAGARPNARRARPKARSASKRSKTAARPGRTRRAAPAKRPPAPSARPASKLSAAAETIGRVVGRTLATVAERVPFVGRNGSLDAIELLEQDHRRLEELLAEGEDTTPRATKNRATLLRTITAELNAHELIEEKILYPALKPHSEARQIVLEGYQEHHVADLIVDELHRLAGSDERWGAKFKVLKENIEHHIEEEEGEMFKTARSVLSRERLEELGAEMQAMKQRALARA
jgi:hypothetical protein